MVSNLKIKNYIENRAFVKDLKKTTFLTTRWIFICTIKIIKTDKIIPCPLSQMKNKMKINEDQLIVP